VCSAGHYAVLDGNGDGTGGALAHAGNQIRESQGLPLLSREGFLEGMPTRSHLLAGRFTPAGANPSAELPLRQ